VLSRRRRLGLRFGFLRRRRCVVEHRGDELVPATAHRPDEALRFAVVAQRPSSRLDPARQRRLADESAAPHRVEQLLFGDAAFAVDDQLRQDVEHLRLDADDLVTVTQFVALRVKHETVEAPHGGSRLSPAVGRPGGAHQSVTQFTQFRRVRAFFDRGGDVLCSASHLIDTVGQLGGLFGGQHHRIRGQRGAPDLRPLLVGALPTRLPAVLTAPAETRVGHFATTPPA
jgi:hypothetical protein